MPTGYTQGILDGSIQSFNEFAKLCMRNFGACMHMRDEPFDAEYKPAQPSEYYQEKIDKCKAELLLIESKSDEDFKADAIDVLKTELSLIQKMIDKCKENQVILYSFMKQAKAFVPPTPDHDGIKEFMIDQIKSTIDYDGNSSYYEERRASIESEIIGFNVSDYRLKKIKALNKDLMYYKQQLSNDIDRCNKANKWVLDFHNALK